MRGTVVVVAGWLAGCGPLIVLEGDSDSDAESEASTSGAPGSTAPPPGTTELPSVTTVSPAAVSGSDESDDATTGDPVTSVSFLDGFDYVPPADECSLWEQDCPRGEKCMPWANDGGNDWNALRSTPIDGDPDAPGEPCTVEGSGMSGFDSCALGAMCWGVDPETLEGTSWPSAWAPRRNPAARTPRRRARSAPGSWRCVPPFAVRCCRTAP